MKIVIISPHRDDAAFSLGLSITAWLAAGHLVTVINCFTRSEYAPFTEVEHMHPNDRMPRITAIRQREDLAWRRLYPAGLTLADLNLKDAPLRRHCSANAVCDLPVDTSDKALYRIQRAVERETPDALLLPLALGAHVDHLTARDALLPTATSDLPAAFYEDLPYATRSGVADTIEPLAHSLQLGLEPTFAGLPMDVDAAVLRKRRLALSYDSQIDSAVTAEIADFCIRYEGRERLWANPAWLRSSLALPQPSAEAASS